jgi:hypothetical protein
MGDASLMRRRHILAGLLLALAAPLAAEAQRAATVMHSAPRAEAACSTSPLGFLGLDVPARGDAVRVRALHTWLDTWRGIGGKAVAPGSGRTHRGRPHLDMLGANE